MRLRSFMAVVLVFASTSLARADAPASGSGAQWGGSTSGASRLHGTGGFLTAAGISGGVAILADLFKDTSKGVHVNVPQPSSPTRAPEISTSGEVSGLVLLLGGALILREKQRARI